MPEAATNATKEFSTIIATHAHLNYYENECKCYKYPTNQGLKSYLKSFFIHFINEEINKVTNLIFF